MNSNRIAVVVVCYRMLRSIFAIILIKYHKFRFFAAKQVFSKLKQQDKEEKFRHKIVPIEGDCSLPGLGISETDRRKLIENCEIIFHAAATVRFDEKLKLALAINVNGTKEIMLLSKAAKSLVVSVVFCAMYANSDGCY